MLLAPGDAASLASQEQDAAASTKETNAAKQTEKIPADQLDSLVAPIALYPDPLLAQTLAASTYPLEIVQLQQWLAKHKDLKDKALADAVAKEPWDPSVQSMAGLPDVVKRLVDEAAHGGDVAHADEFCCLGPAMFRNNPVSAINEDRTDKSEFFDARCNLLDLLCSVRAWIPCPRL
jgi:hypothetical protein